MTKYKIAGATALSIAIQLALSPAYADERRAAPLTTLSAIEVTARRVTEDVQSVPIAVTAIDAALIERQQITNIRSLEAAIPNIVFVPNTGQMSAATIFLRGVGEDESFFTADPPVGIYIDDVYIPRQTGALFDLYDIARLEVLRGPQGTLYGRNTSAGAVKLESRRPQLEFGFNSDIRVGSYDRQDLRLSVTGPLIGEQLAGQVAVMSRQSDGYTRNLVDGRRVNDQDIKGVRASLLWRPDERFEMLLVGDGTNERSGPGYGVAIVNDAVPGRLAQVNDWHDTRSDLLDPIQDVDQAGASLTMTYNAPSATLKAITAWRELTQDILLDADGRDGNPLNLGPAPGFVAFHLAQTQEQRQFSQELQVTGSQLGDRLTYAAGLYYFNERNGQYTTNLAFVPATTRPRTVNHTYVTLDTESIAVFGDLTYALTDAFSVSAGLRWTQDDKDFNVEALNGAGQIRLTTTGIPASRSIAESWSDTTPRVSLNYQLSGKSWEALAYLSAAKGFKSGGFDGREGNPDYIMTQLGPIDPETVWSYEAGLKADWLDSRLRTNVAIFFNDYKDMQFGITKTDGSGFTRLNAGDAEISGVELELTAVPTEGLELFANFGYLDGEYTKFRDPSACFFATESEAKSTLELKKAPKTTWRIGGNYTYDFGAGGQVIVGADYSEKDRYYNNLCNSAVIATTGYENLNAQIAYQSADGRWRLTLSGTNLTDAVYWQGGFDFSAALGDAVYVVPPRMWALNLRYSTN